MAGLVAPGKVPTPQARPAPMGRASLPMGGGAAQNLGNIRAPALPRPSIQAGSAVNPAGVYSSWTPGAVSMTGQQTAPGQRTEIDLDQQRRTRNINDAEQLALISGPGGGQGGGGGTSGGDGGGSAAAPPPLSKDDILGLLTSLKGPEAPREAPPTPQPRVQAPTPTAAPPSASMGFARYKDQSGRLANSALRGLRDEMTSRGISGSGIEAANTARIYSDAMRGQADNAYQQQARSEDQSWQAQQMGYQGDLTQRAQDLGLSSTGYQGGIQQRGQDMGYNNMSQMMPSILSYLSQSSRRY
jgi:hypothetical protein